MSALNFIRFGVEFTPEQWGVFNESPVWALDPPQRESFENDRDYALAEVEYCNRVLAARSTGGEKP